MKPPVASSLVATRVLDTAGAQQSDMHLWRAQFLRFGLLARSDTFMYFTSRRLTALGTWHRGFWVLGCPRYWIPPSLLLQPAIRTQAVTYSMPADMEQPRLRDCSARELADYMLEHRFQVSQYYAYCIWWLIAR